MSHEAMLMSEDGLRRRTNEVSQARFNAMNFVEKVAFANTVLKRLEIDVEEDLTAHLVVEAVHESSRIVPAVVKDDHEDGSDITLQQAQGFILDVIRRVNEKWHYGHIWPPSQNDLTIAICWEDGPLRS